MYNTWSNQVPCTSNILLKQDYLEFLGCHQDQKVQNHLRVTIHRPMTVKMVKKPHTGKWRLFEFREGNREKTEDELEKGVKIHK